VCVCWVGVIWGVREGRKEGGREGGREEMCRTCYIKPSFLTVEEEEEEGWVVRSTGREECREAKEQQQQQMQQMQQTQQTQQQQQQQRSVG